MTASRGLARESNGAPVGVTEDFSLYLRAHGDVDSRRRRIWPRSPSRSLRRSQQRRRRPVAQRQREDGAAGHQCSERRGDGAPADAPRPLRAGRRRRAASGAGSVISHRIPGPVRAGKLRRCGVPVRRQRTANEQGLLTNLVLRSRQVDEMLMHDSDVRTYVCLSSYGPGTLSPPGGPVPRGSVTTATQCAALSIMSNRGSRSSCCGSTLALRQYTHAALYLACHDALYSRHVSVDRRQARRLRQATRRSVTLHDPIVACVQRPGRRAPGTASCHTAGLTAAGGTAC